VCSCGGLNHGIGLLYQTVTVDSTVKLERADARAEKNAAKYRAAGEEWRRLRAEYTAAFEARFGRLIEAKSRGEWLSGEDFATWCRLRDWHQARNHIGAMTGPSRNGKLAALIAKLKEGGAA
jgi:hypothetical protein